MHELFARMIEVVFPAFWQVKFVMEYDERKEWRADAKTAKQRAQHTAVLAHNYCT